MGSFEQIFLLLAAIEGLEILTAGYAAQAALCKMHGDNVGYERNLDRAQDAVTAMRLISDLRCGNDNPRIIPDVIPGYQKSFRDITFSENAITRLAADLLGVPCLPRTPHYPEL